MGKTPKKIVRPEPVTDDRVYWGILAEGAKSPELLFSERKFAEAMLSVMTPEQREKTQIVRTYVTVWRLGDKGRIPKRSPRGKAS